MLHICVAEILRKTCCSLVCAATWAAAVRHDQGVFIFGQGLGQILAVLGKTDGRGHDRPAEVVHPRVPAAGGVDEAGALGDEGLGQFGMSRDGLWIVARARRSGQELEVLLERLDNNR